MNWTYMTDSELVRSAQTALHPGNTLAHELVRRLDASVALQALLVEAPGVDWTDLADVQRVAKLVRVLDEHDLRDPDDLEAALNRAQAVADIADEIPVDALTTLVDLLRDNSPRKR